MEFSDTNSSQIFYISTSQENTSSKDIFNKALTNSLDTTANDSNFNSTERTNEKVQTTDKRPLSFETNTISSISEVYHTKTDTLVEELTEDKSSIREETSKEVVLNISLKYLEPKNTELNANGKNHSKAYDFNYNSTKTTTNYQMNSIINEQSYQSSHNSTEQIQDDKMQSTESAVPNYENNNNPEQETTYSRSTLTIKSSIENKKSTLYVNKSKVNKSIMGLITTKNTNKKIIPVKQTPKTPAPPNRIIPKYKPQPPRATTIKILMNRNESNS